MIYPPWDSTDMINEKYEIITSPEYSQPNDSTIYTSLKTKQMINQSVDSNCVFEYSTSDANLIIPKNQTNKEMLKINAVSTNKVQLSGRSIDKILQQQDKGLGNDYNIFSSKKTVAEIKNACNEIQNQLNIAIENNKAFDTEIIDDTIIYKLKLPDDVLLQAGQERLMNLDDENINWQNLLNDTAMTMNLINENTNSVNNVVLTGMNIITSDDSMLQVQGSNLRHYKKFGEDIYTNEFQTDEILIGKLMINETVNGINGIIYSNENDAETNKLMSETKTNEIIDTKISDSQFMTENVELASGENVNYDYRFKKENAQLTLSSINAENYINFKQNRFLELYKTADITDSFTTELDDRDLLTGGAIQKLISLKPSSGFKYLRGDVLNLFSVTSNPNLDEHKNYLPSGCKYYLTSITTMPIQSFPWFDGSTPKTKYDSFVEWRIVDNVLEFSLYLNYVSGSGTYDCNYNKLFGEEGNTFFSEIFNEINYTGFSECSMGFSSSIQCYAYLNNYSVNSSFETNNIIQEPKPQIENAQTRYKFTYNSLSGTSSIPENTIEFFSNAIQLTSTNIEVYRYKVFSFKFKIQTYNISVPASILQKANIQRWTVQ